jgi:hypothetical protein
VIRAACRGLGENDDSSRQRGGCQAEDGEKRYDTPHVVDVRSSRVDSSRRRRIHGIRLLHGPGGSSFRDLVWTQIGWLVQQ